ncbi:reductase [Xylariales sp. AK1849]|nr:reductase [Xylariales sp. AK1849]
MHFLILGGTGFVGRVAAIEAIARGHEGATTIVGDRLAPDGLSALNDLTFDAAIDTWSKEPEVVVRAVEALRGYVKHYSYISSISVYDHENIDFSKLYTEDTRLYDVTARDSKNSEYQYNKRSGEIAAEKADVPVLLARPGWLDRLHRVACTLAPGPRDFSVQFVDVRDLAAFVVDAAERRLAGAYNVISKPGYTTMGQFLAIGNEITAGAKPWTELPMWITPDAPEHVQMYRWDTSKARDAGLQSTSCDDTKPLPMPDGDESPKLGLSPEKEAKLLG